MNCLYTKKYYDKNLNLSFEVNILTDYDFEKLSDESSYQKIFVDNCGNHVEVVKEVCLKDISTNDWLSKCNFRRKIVKLYITENTNSKINIKKSIDDIVNKIYNQAKEEYTNLKKSQVRLYSYRKGDKFLSQHFPKEKKYKYEYCRAALCVIDNSFEIPSEDVYFFGVVNKTIKSKDNKFIDIITPISSYLSNNLYKDNAICLEDMLIKILVSIMELDKADETFFRIFYYYAKKYEDIMKFYKSTILYVSGPSILENKKIKEMLAEYKKDVISLMKCDIDKIIFIYDIITSKQPISNDMVYTLIVPYFKRYLKFTKDEEFLLVYCNKEQEIKKISSLDIKLCNNFKIKKDEDGFYYFIKKREYIS